MSYENVYVSLWYWFITKEHIYGTKQWQFMYIYKRKYKDKLLAKYKE